jgi:hypothetical protein
MNGEFVGGVDFLHAVLGHGVGGVANIGGDFVLGDFAGAHVLEELRLLGQSFPGGPGRLDLLRRLDGGPFVLGDDAEEVAFAHNADDAGDTLN